MITQLKQNWRGHSLDMLLLDIFIKGKSDCRLWLPVLCKHLLRRKCQLYEQPEQL